MPGTCVSAGPSTEYRDADTDPQRVSCSDASCDAYASNTCTDCSSTYILDIAGACVFACPATKHGVVDTDLLCSSRSTASCGVCPFDTTAAMAPSWT